jgi:two-component system, chemotaxis family, CheB/CheR fusion protein
VIFLDTHFHIRRFTPATKDLIELIPSDIGRPLSDLAIKFADPDLILDIQQVLEKLVPIGRIVPSASGKWYMRRVLPYRTVDNHIDGIVITFVDITDRKQAEEDLVRAKQSAEAAIQMKDQFLATLSHELRTPLSAILLWANMLRNKKIQATRFDDGINAIEKSAQAQKALVDDLLDTARITSGKLRIEKREADLSRLIHTSVEAIKPIANANDISIHADLAPDVGVVIADPEHLQQVVWNILSNAVKFTPAGGNVHVALDRAQVPRSRSLFPCRAKRARSTAAMVTPVPPEKIVRSTWPA